MRDLQVYMRFSPRFILNPQGPQQNLSLGVNPIDNAEPCYPHCKIPGVWLHLFPKTRLAQCLPLSWCRLSVVVLWSLCRATHGLPFRAPVYRGCPLLGHIGVPQESRMTLGAKRQQFFVWLLVVLESWHHVFLCARVRGRVSRSCATENTYTCSTGSAVQPLSRHHSQSFVSFPPNFLRVVGVLSNSSSCSRSHRTFLACCV